MTPRCTAQRRRIYPWATALMLGGTASTAKAVDRPSGDAFQIRYYKTTADGERGAAFSDRDLPNFVNRARCECEQNIWTEIRIASSMSVPNTSVRVEAYVGSRCDDASNNNQLVNPCVRALSSSASAFLSGQQKFQFAPIWLAGGVARNGSQELGKATPQGSCSQGQGQAGVWICAEDGMLPGCQGDDWVVSGSQNANVEGMSVPLAYDFDPPHNLPPKDSFTVSEGDGAVLIEWDVAATGDVYAYRVLCADEDGNPLPGRGLSAPNVAALNQTVYYTKNNLCPDGPFGPKKAGAGDSGGTSGGDTDGGTTDGGTTDGGTTDGTTGGDTTGDATTSAGDTGTTGTSSDSGGTNELPSSGIESLDWAYVCSGTISASSHSYRVSGLENDVPHRFLVVAHDAAGNPIAASKVITATPRETSDFWEQCEAEPEVCGSGGFCACTSPAPLNDGAAGLGVMALVFLTLRRRRTAP